MAEVWRLMYNIIMFLTANILSRTTIDWIRQTMTNNIHVYIVNGWLARINNVTKSKACIMPNKMGALEPHSHLDIKVHKSVLVVYLATLADRNWSERDCFASFRFTMSFLSCHVLVCFALQCRCAMLALLHSHHSQLIIFQRNCCYNC